MRFLYGDKNSLRVLDETEFWKRQEAEHTVVIRAVLPELEEKFVKHLEDFESKFIKTEGEAIRYMETVIRTGGNVSPELNESIMCFIDYAMRESECFLRLIDDILTNSEAAKDNSLAITVIKHIRRESEYYIGIAQMILYKGRV